MAQTVQILMQDDIDGSTEDIQSTTFALGNKAYEIDLGPKNLQALQDALAPYISAARPDRKAKRTRVASNSTEDIKAIRTWAQDNGYEVSDRGRIPNEIREAYHTAGGAPLAKAS